MQHVIAHTTSGTQVTLDWSPLDFLEEEEELEELDLEEIYSYGKEAGNIAQQFDITTGTLRSVIKGSEVGDDRVDITRSGRKACSCMMAQGSIVGMKTSKEDTYISRKYWNFCEVTSTIPTDPQSSYHHARKSGDFSALGYNDSIVLRIILDVSKADHSHSSTPEGKMSLLGARLSTPRKELRAMWHIASLFQDAMLSTHTAESPKYLPQQMGGMGVTPLFDNSDNILLYVKAYRGGTYSRIYGTAVAELSSCLMYLERGKQTAPVLSQRLRERQDYFWGTFADKVFVPKHPQLISEKGKGAPKPLYEATGGSNNFQAFESRLTRTKHLVPRSKAEIEWESSRRLRGLMEAIYSDVFQLDKESRVQRTVVRSHYDNALNSNAALQRLLNREASGSDVKRLIGDKNFRMITTGKREFTRSDATWVYNDGRGELYSLKDISLSEDMYVRKEVSEEETFKVGGLKLSPIIGDVRKQVTTVTKVGLYEINKTMESWSDDLLDRLIKRADETSRPLPRNHLEEVFWEDPEWVNDDSGLIGRCLNENRQASVKSLAVLLVSDDHRLGNQMARQCSLTVHRFSSRDFMSLATAHGLTVSSTCDFTPMIPHMVRPTHPPSERLYVDTGSLLAQGSRMEVVGDSIITRTLLRTGWNSTGQRTSQARIEPVLKLRSIGKVHTHSSLTRPKLFKSGSRPSQTVYSQEGSWRSSNMSLPNHTWS
jgi:hypothetical protein